MTDDTDDVRRQVEALAAQLERAQADSVELTRLQQMMARLLEILVHKGVLAAAQPGHIARFGEAKSRPRVHLAIVADKRAVKSPDVDCASLLHLCHGRCCAMQVILSEEDLREQRFRFDVHKPYVLARADDGYCTHLRQDGTGCEVYEDRPAHCRAYDCREDPRVWIDFEQKIAQPIEHLWVTEPRRVPAPTPPPPKPPSPTE